MLTARPPPSAFNVTDRDLHEAKAIADTMTLDEVKAVRHPRWWHPCCATCADPSQQLMEKVLLVHGSDPNFPFPIITKIKEFLGEYQPAIGVVTLC